MARTITRVRKHGTAPTRISSVFAFTVLTGTSFVTGCSSTRSYEIPNSSAWQPAQQAQDAYTRWRAPSNDDRQNGSSRTNETSAIVVDSKNPYITVLEQQDALWGSQNVPGEPLSLDIPVQSPAWEEPINQGRRSVIAINHESLTAENRFRELGDVFQLGTPLLALERATIADDHEGMRQWARHLIFTASATQGLKSAFNNTPLGARPDGGDHNFPSGHTSAALSGASFIRRRYGMEEAIPYYALGTLVGASRIEADRHDVWAILGAFALSELSAELFVTEPSATDRPFGDNAVRSFMDSQFGPENWRITPGVHNTGQETDIWIHIDLSF